MRTLPKVLIAFAFCAISILGSDWYVDKDASGAANGTSWTDAWTDAANVVWGVSGVKAGDTLYISGGSTSKTYTNSWIVGASGSNGSPITIRPGQEANHNGLVIFDGSAWGDSCDTNCILASAKSNLIFDGSFGGLQHLVIQNWYNTNYTIKGKAFYMIGCTNINFMHCIMSNVNVGVQADTYPEHINVGWCSIRARGDACLRFISSVASPPNYWDSHLVFSNRFETLFSRVTRSCADGIQSHDGLTAFNNRFETLWTDEITPGQHEDFLQSDGGWTKMYNNEVVNIADAGFSPSPWTAGDSIENVRIYNNIFRTTEYMDDYPNYIRMYNNEGLGRYQNVYVVNNLFVDSTNENSQAVFIGTELGETPGTNNVFANNIFVNVGAGSSYVWQFDQSQGAQSQWTITNNIIYHATPGNARVRYFGTNYTAAQWKSIDPTTGTNLPSFVRYVQNSTNNDFNLKLSDTVAAGHGINYSGIFTKDYNGNTRGSQWSIGPFEPVSILSIGTLTINSINGR